MAKKKECEHKKPFSLKGNQDEAICINCCISKVVVQLLLPSIFWPGWPDAFVKKIAQI
jgi:hypothetical protein